MLTQETRETYFFWIKEHICKNIFDALPIFCDWLEDNNIRSQRWREVEKLLKYTKYYNYHNTKYVSGVIVLTSKKAISIFYWHPSNKIEIKIQNRKSYPTNKNIEAQLSLHTGKPLWTKVG